MGEQSQAKNHRNNTAQHNKPINHFNRALTIQFIYLLFVQVITKPRAFCSHNNYMKMHTHGISDTNRVYFAVVLKLS